MQTQRLTAKQTPMLIQILKVRQISKQKEKLTAKLKLKQTQTQMGMHLSKHWGKQKVKLI
jgi:hypothetical protein